MSKMICPFNQGECKKEECPLYVKMYLNKGKDEFEEEFKCTFAWLPTLLVELKEKK